MQSAGYDPRAEAISDEADPNAMVLLGGLAYEDTSLFNVHFLDEILALTPSSASYFDVGTLDGYLETNRVLSQPNSEELLSCPR